VLAQKAQEWDKIIKIGRTHLADATPLRLGQEFGGFRPADGAVGRAGPQAIEPVLELPAGGTAVGTGINTHPEFGRRVAEVLAEETGIPFVEAVESLRGQRPARRPGRVPRPARAIAVTLFNVANNIRWLGSGPRCGFLRSQAARPPAGQLDHAGQGEPGDVREHDAGGRPRDGQRPDDRLQRRRRRAVPAEHHDARDGPRGAREHPPAGRGTRAFVDFCAEGDGSQRRACEASVEKSLSMVTSLNPHIGYEKAAALAKEAFKTGKTIRELCREEGHPARGDAQRGARSVEHDRAAAETRRKSLQQLAVDVTGGRVTLSGRVASFYEKQIAIQACRNRADIPADRLEVA
jgi:fumarate hydratase, class II